MIMRYLPISFIALGAMSSLSIQAEEVVPGFSLEDLNPKSLRYEQMISPYDYKLQVSAYYFGSAG